MTQPGPLTPEETTRIRAEERVRQQAREEEKGRAGLIGCSTLLALMGVGFLFGSKPLAFLPWLAVGLVVAGVLGTRKGWSASWGGWGKFLVTALAVGSLLYFFVSVTFAA